MDMEKQLDDAIWEGDGDAIDAMTGVYESLGDYIDEKGTWPWIQFAAQRGGASVIRAMLDAGFDIDVARLPEKSTALITAIGCDHDDVVELLLERGANPNIGRPLISALDETKSPERRLKYVKLLVEHGADVNRLYDLYGDPTNQFTALDWTNDPDVIAYLRQHGAKSIAEQKGEVVEAEVVQDTPDSPSTAEQVVSYFQETFGAVDRRSLVEVVPTGYPISIHAIRPEGNRKHWTLFTTGLSDSPMPTPPGQEEYALAELFLQLPGDWFAGEDWSQLEKCPVEQLWPLDWLRRVAQYPHDQGTWLGAPVTIIANGDPPQPLGPGVAFTSILLACEKSFRLNDEQHFQLYRLMPIYSDERELELREGAPALMRAFDRNDVPFVLDVNRHSVANK